MSTRDKDELDLVEVLRALWVYKWLIIVVTALFGAASVYLALEATPIFRANAVVAKVETNAGGGGSALASQFGGLGRLAGLGLGQGGPTQEARAILESRHLTEIFIQRHDVLKEFETAGGDQPTLWQGVKRFRDTILTVRDAATEGMTSIAMEWTDPDLAAQWANDYAALANEVIRARALEQSQNNIEYLKNQAEQNDVVELERAIYNLIETEIQKLMLANAREEYAFSVVDPAVAPELRSKPKRTLMVLTGGAIGFIVSIALVLLWSLIKRVREYHAADGKPA